MQTNHIFKVLIIYLDIFSNQRDHFGLRFLRSLCCSLRALYFIFIGDQVTIVLSCEPSELSLSHLIAKSIDLIRSSHEQ